MGFSTEEINTLVERQLAEWPLCHDNFFRLRDTRRKPARLGDLECAVQLNPARIRSTGAAVDRESIGKRPCFLCRANRPSEQIVSRWAGDALKDWEVLVNPYPILPIHFTIVSESHVPQSAVPLEMAAMAEQAPSLAIFYNGARAGASAPDHLHAQAVLHSELPLLRLAEKHHPSARGGFMSSEEFGLDLPFQFLSAVITPDAEGMRALGLIPGAFGIDAVTGQPDRGLVNAFFWMSVPEEGGAPVLRVVIVPRRRHRPSCYGTEPGRMVVSPGAIDMAGLMITPRPEDFERLDADAMKQIYAEVAFADKLPEAVKRYFGVKQ